MKKIIAFILVLLFVFTLCACDIDSGEYETDGKPIIVLPDKETAETINGYKPAPESSEDSSSVESTSSKPTLDLTFENAAIVGNKNSLKYHVKDCRYATKILEENLALFSSADEAIKEGYKACGVCFKK